MKNSTIRKLIVTLLVMTLLSTMMFTIVASGSESGTVTYSMTADEITPFSAGAKADGDSEQLGTDGYFNVFYSAKTKVCVCTGVCVYTHGCVCVCVCRGPGMGHS